MIRRLIVGALIITTPILAQGPNLGAERAAVRSLFDHMSTALCAGDWVAYQDTWAQDSTVERLDAASATWLTGWMALSKFYQSMMPRIRGCRFELRKFSVHVSRDATMAWAVSEGVLRMADTTVAPVVLWGAFGFEKRSGAWRMVFDHSAVRPTREKTPKE